MPRTHRKLRTVSSINGVEKTGYSYAEEWNWTHFIPCTKINSKWIKDLNVSTETVKPLENMEKKFLDIGLGNHFLNMNPWAQATKAKIKNGTESN